MKEGNIYYGAAANLSNCRNIFSTVSVEQQQQQPRDNSNNQGLHQLLTAAIRQPIHIVESLSSHQQQQEQQQQQESNGIDGEDNDETFILWGPAPVEVDFHYENDETKRLQMGQLVITSQQLIFWMNAIHTNVSVVEDSMSESSFVLYEYDLRVDATCIDLHALTASTGSTTPNRNHPPNSNGGHQNIDLVEDDSLNNDEGKFQDVDDEEEEGDNNNKNNNDNSNNNKNKNDCGVYVQLSQGDNEEESDDGDTNFQELTFRILPSPSNHHHQQHQHSGHTLFAAMSQLITLHPIDPNNDDQHNHSNDTCHFPTTGSAPTMWFGEGPVMTADGIIQLPDYDDVEEDENEIIHQYNHDDEVDDDDDDDDALIVAPPRQQLYHTLTTENDNEQQQQRNAMLERLDRLLIVPPEYEYPEDDTKSHPDDSHQFDDADIDDSDNDLL